MNMLADGNAVILSQFFHMCCHVLLLPYIKRADEGVVMIEGTAGRQRSAHLGQILLSRAYPFIKPIAKYLVSSGVSWEWAW